MTVIASAVITSPFRPVESYWFMKWLIKVYRFDSFLLSNSDCAFKIPATVLGESLCHPIDLKIYGMDKETKAAIFWVVGQHFKMCAQQGRKEKFMAKE
jgi:hypothetical protein